MIQTIIDYTRAAEQAVVRNLQKIEPKINEFIGTDILPIAQRINEIALHAFYVIASTLLYLSNSSVFIIGAVSAIVSPEKMESAIAKIIEVWERQSFSSRCMICLASIFAWPITMACAAFFVGGALSLQLQQLNPIPTCNVVEATHV